MRPKQVLRFFIITISYILLVAGLAKAQEFTYQAKLDRVVGDREGTLVISPVGIQFETQDPKDKLVWVYNDIRLLEIFTPTTIRLRSYEAHKWLMLGKDQQFSFHLLESKIDDKLIEFLRSRSERPFITSFPTLETTTQPLASLAVKHQHRLGGCQGTIQIYLDRLVFITSDKHDSRSWRWNEIQSIGRPDQGKLEILTYELQTGGPQRSYNFILKEPLSAELYDMIWSQVYQSLPLIKPEKERNTTLLKQ